MQDEPDTGQPPTGELRHDPFVALLRWLARAHGGFDALAAKSGIGLRTLQDWHQGRYPRQRQSAKVVALHQWALRNDSTYPPDWAPHGGLADLAGPARIQVGGLTSLAHPAPPTSPGHPEERIPLEPPPSFPSARAHPRGWRRTVLIAVIPTVVAAGTIVAVVLVH
jgi:hypothetical protein